MTVKSDPVLLDSINYLIPDHAGRVVVAGSHGGLYCAFKCLSCRVRGVILNDAGVGRDAAGIASLAACEPHRLPAAMVDFRSARIGDCRDIVERGLISACNATAHALGVRLGMACRQAAAVLERGAPGFQPVQAQHEHRHEVSFGELTEAVVCLDSASLIQPGDAGRVVVTGSHGGLIGGNPAKAANVAARFLAFNDAGFGMDDAGAGRLVPLADRGVAAVVVDCASARIGDGLSTLHDGIISRANHVAGDEGFREGEKLERCLRRYLCQGIQPGGTP
ncbi:MAG: hypothetical protein LUE17_10280 [Planctomycetaceae bacterium]|nr:hypothetical protein [Planctomycetaceae bacterium]